jgi:hypothetical protein
MSGSLPLYSQPLVLAVNHPRCNVTFLAAKSSNAFDDQKYRLKDVFKYSWLLTDAGCSNHGHLKKLIHNSSYLSKCVATTNSYHDDLIWLVCALI